MKGSERAQAIALRRDGASYQKIRQGLGIAKSTLWRWLKNEGLVESQSQQLTELRRTAQRKAVNAVRRTRLEKTHTIMSEARRDIDQITLSELRLIGAALYWAEGAKQKEHKGQASAQVVFSNTDPRMLRVFVAFLHQCCGIEPSTLRFRIYLHETADATDARIYWHHQLGIEAITTAPVTWKRHKRSVHRVNVGAGYHGLLRIIVPSSTDLNRRISGWIDGMCEVGCLWGVV